MTATITSGVTTFDKDGNATTSYEGCVLRLGTDWNSSMDITSYYALVWDRETQRVKHVYYGSDFDGGYGNGHATVDATDEVKSEVLAHFTAKAESARQAIVESFEDTIARGDTVEVTGGRKFKGETGKVFWVGEADSFRGRARRVGIETADGGRIFVDAHQATITEMYPGKQADAEAEGRYYVASEINQARRSYGIR